LHEFSTCDAFNITCFQSQTENWPKTSQKMKSVPQNAYVANASEAAVEQSVKLDSCIKACTFVKDKIGFRIAKKGVCSMFF